MATTYTHLAGLVLTASERKRVKDMAERCEGDLYTLYREVITRGFLTTSMATGDSVSDEWLLASDNDETYTTLFSGVDFTAVMDRLDYIK